MDYVWFKIVGTNCSGISGYLLVSEMVVLVQVEPTGFLCLCWFFCVHDVLWVEN